ncbi:hypothetical protein Mal35_51920 [Gimesia maris]|nr:hypothetical protein Mal35_51920 [Gimesia maris]
MNHRPSGNRSLHWGLKTITERIQKGGYLKVSQTNRDSNVRPLRPELIGCISSILWSKVWQTITSFKTVEEPSCSGSRLRSAVRSQETNLQSLVCIASNSGLPSTSGYLSPSSLAMVGAITVLSTVGSFTPVRMPAPDRMHMAFIFGSFARNP